MPSHFSRPSLAHWAVGVGVACLGLVGTALMTLYQAQSAQRIEQERFTQAADAFVRALTGRMDAYVEIAFGLRGLFIANPALGRRAFHEAVTRLEIDRRYPGLKNVAFTRLVSADRRAAFEREVRADTSLDPLGYPDFTIRPPGERSQYFVADYLWPLSGSQGVHGLDISAQPANLASMEFARTTGQPTASGPFDLLQETTHRAGFVVRVPVFSPEFMGAVGVTIRVHDLFQNMERDGLSGGLRFALSDQGSAIAPDLPANRTPMYSSLASDAAAPLAYSRELGVYGRKWRLDFQPALPYLSGSEMHAPWLTAGAGGSLSVLLGLLVALLARDRSLALARASSSAQALKESELRWRFAIEGSGDGLWDWDVVANTTFYSDRWKEIMGFQPHELTGNRDQGSLRLHPDDKERVLAAVAAHLDQKTPQYRSEHRVICKDGSTKWVLARGLVVERAEDGKALRMVATTKDITQRKADERALADSEGRLAGVFETAMDAIISIDAAHRIILFNAAAEKMFGHTSQQMLGQPLDQLLPQNLRAMHSSHIHAYGAGNSSTRTMGALGALTAIRASGEAFPIEASISRVVVSDQVIFTVILRDITESKRAAEQLQQSLHLLNRLSDQVPGALFQLRMAPNGHMSMPFASRGFQELFEVAADQVRLDNRVLFANVHPEDQAGTTEALHKSALGLDNWMMSFRYRLAGQGYRWRMAQARPERQADGATVWYGFVTDITERLEAESRLRELNERLELRVLERTQELQAALESSEAAKRSRGEFLAKMSHEIRTPLNAVLGMVYLALRARPDPMQAQYLQKIQTSGEHLLHVINDILDFSKIDVGKLELERSPLDLDRLLDNVLQLSEGTAREKGLALTCRVEDDVPRQMVGDSLRLEQVLINYVNNALKFTAQGAISIHVHRVPHGQPLAPGVPCVICFEVTDTGIGLSEEQIARLFESFEQADNSTTRKFGGSGLGLAICKQLASLMGGQVGVTSQEGAGSTFWFTATLQVPEPAAALLPAPAEPPPAFGGLRGRPVLVVDDNDINLEVAKGVLEQVGVRVTVARDGAEAIHLLHQQAFDAVLMDMHMPVMDGLEATRRIRADASIATVPVIAMTANANPEEHTLCLQAGMNDVLTKPVLPQRLFETLQRWTASAQAQPHAAQG